MQLGHKMAQPVRLMDRSRNREKSYKKARGFVRAVSVEKSSIEAAARWNLPGGLETVPGDHGFFLFSDKREGSVLCLEFQCQTRAGDSVAQVNSGVSRVFGFQDVQDGILQFG